MLKGDKQPIESKGFDPEKIWQEFFKIFHRAPTEEELKEKARYERRLTESEIKHRRPDPKFYEKNTKSILTIHKFWQRRKGRDRLLTINCNAAHNPDFKEFLHGQKIKKSINLWKMDFLLTAIREGDWEHKIFSVRYLPELTVALFAGGKITQQQASSVLELSGILKEHKLLEIVPVLESKTEKEPQLSAKSKEILNLISQHKYFNELDQEQLTELALLVAKLPPSERFWFVIDGNQYKHKDINPLARAVINSHALYDVKTEKNLKFYCPSAGLRDALGIVRFGLKNYVKTVPILGKITPYEIGEGLKEHKHYAAMNYREIISYTEIHGQKNTEITYLIALYHDVFHSFASAIFGYELLTGMLYLANDVAETILIDIKPKFGPLPETKETWDFKDGTAQPFMYRNPKKYNTREFRSNQLTSNEVTKLFLENMLSKFDGGHHLLRINENDGQQQLTTVGAIFILKFLENPERWKSIKIDLDQFSVKIESDEEKSVDKPTLEFIRHYSRIKSIYPKIKDDSIKIKLLNVFLSETVTDAPTTLTKIPDKEAIAEEKFKFKKFTKKEVEEYSLPEKFTNTLWSTYRGRSLEVGDLNSHQMIMSDIEQSSTSTI